MNTGTDIYHASASKVNKDGTVTTDVYIIKDGQWKNSATTTDGGKSYTYDDDVAGAGLKNELNNPDGAIHKNVDANINKAADSAGVTKDIKDNMVDGNGNTANDADDGADDGGDNDAPTEPKKPGSDPQQRLDYGREAPLRYPVDLAQESQDFLKIMMVEYQPRGLNFQGGLGIPSRPNLSVTQKADSQTVGDRNILKSIYLPIPNGVQDSNGVDWDADRIDVVRYRTDLVGKLIQGGDVAGTAGAADAVTDNTDAVKEAASAKITESITGVNKLARETGAVLNNNLELLFKGHNFATLVLPSICLLEVQQKVRLLCKLLEP